MRYNVNFMLSGCIPVEAESKLEAMKLVVNMGERELTANTSLKIHSVEEVTE